MLLRVALVFLLIAASMPVSAAPAEAKGWPRENSFAWYAVEFGESVPGFSTETRLLAGFRFHDGEWEMRCFGRTITTLGNERPVMTHLRERSQDAPPTGPTPVAVGDRVRVDAVRACGTTFFDVDVEAIEQGRGRRGDIIVGHDEPECRCQETDATWSAASGIVLTWKFAGSTSHQQGQLIATNAPLR